MTAQSHLLTHCGARVVTREELDGVEAPPATATWFPVKHAGVIDAVSRTLAGAGFAVRTMKFALSRGDARMFSTLDLDSPLAPGVSLAVGVRNSTDKSFPLGFCAGSKVFVCDNLAFRSDLLVRRKHTRFGRDRFEEAIAQAVQSLDGFRKAESERVRNFQLTDLSDQAAESVILRGFEKGLVTHRQLPGVIKEWREPSFAEFEPRTLWSLLNAFTTALAPVHAANPQRFCALTIGLQAFLGEAGGLPATELPYGSPA
jgi:hypothetical protein